MREKAWLAVICSILPSASVAGESTNMHENIWAGVRFRRDWRFRA